MQRDFPEVETLRATRTISRKNKVSRPPRHRPGEKFLMGPIPMSWLSAASQLPGKSIAVGLAIWYLAGLRRSNEVKLTRTTLKQFDVGRKAAYRALHSLEEQRLIDVERHRGRCPIIRVLSYP